MLDEATPKAASIEATLNYVDPTATIGAHNDLERQKSTLTLVPHRMAIHDARAAAKQLSLEDTGFVLLRRPTRVTNFYDPAQVETIFLPEVEALVKELTGADRVIIFGTVIRNDNPGAAEGLRKPVYNAHVDYDVPTCRAVAEKNLSPAEWAKYRDGRIILINVWRPIVEVESAPLAVMDGSTMRPPDLIYCPIGGQSVAGVANAAGYNIAYNPGHRWYYVPLQKPDEVLAFKLSDSEPDAVQYAAHTSFKDPTERPDAKRRQSIELRTLSLFAG
jgi:hypothetical protein